MMDHTDILKRAFHITLRYRALWLFGFFLALCSGGGGGGGPSGPSPGGEGNGDLPDFGVPGDFPLNNEQLLIGIAVVFLCLMLFLIAVSVLVQTVTRTSLIRMVRQIEEAGAVTVREGWHLGWSRRALRVFLISLILGLPFLVLILGLIGVVGVAILLASGGNSSLTAVGIVGAVILGVFTILLLILLAVVLAPLRELAWREAALNGQTWRESIGESYSLIRRRLKDVGVLWLIMFGIGLGWGFVSIFLTVIILIVSVVIGGIPAGLAYLFTQSWIAAAVAGIPLFLLVFIVPLTFATGLYLIYQSTVWTLAYQELKA
ncbi:MAG: hypothetical protein ACE5H9_12995 [Anaerolineae bacterium]